MRRGTNVQSGPFEGFRKDHRMRVIQDLQTIDKETEQLIKRIEQSVRAAKLRRSSLEESWRHHYQLYLPMCEREAQIER